MYRIVLNIVSGTGHAENLRIRVFLPPRRDALPSRGDTLRVRSGAVTTRPRARTPSISGSSRHS
eukprot:6211908-Pleurochrysis_carterae.AAC.1